MKHPSALFETLSAAIKTGSLSECKTLFKEFATFPPAFQNKILFEISLAHDNAAFGILAFLAASGDLTGKAKKRVLDLVLDKAHAIPKFIDIYLDFSDMDGLKKAVPLMAGMLLTETDPARLGGMIRSIGKTGDPSCIDVIADFIFYDHDDLKKEAIQALGAIGTPNALAKLKKAAMTNKRDRFLTETLERLEKEALTGEMADIKAAEQRACRKDTYESLEDDSDLAQLLMMLKAPSLTDQNLAIELLVEMGPKVLPAVAGSMDPSRSRSIINTLMILSRLKKSDAVQAILTIIQLKHPDPHVRVAGYEAILRSGTEMAGLHLMGGLEDPSRPVRIAAAKALNGAASDIVIEGLKGKIETCGKKSARDLISEAIVDGFSDTLFMRLIDSDAFAFTASNYLQSAPEPIRKHFTDLLRLKGRRALARSIEYHSEKPVDTHRLTVFIIDASPVMGQIYARYLTGHHISPLLFSGAEEALNALIAARPDLIAMDPFCSGMDGVAFAGEIRKRFSPEELPLLLFDYGEPDVFPKNASPAEPPHSMGRYVKKPMTEKAFAALVSAENLSHALKLVQSPFLENRCLGFSRVLADPLMLQEEDMRKLLLAGNLNVVLPLLKKVSPNRQSTLLSQVREQLLQKMDDPGVRLALFLSLDPHELKASFPMMRYIHDPHELVRMAAVAVVAANPSEAELMEIRNIMESASPEKKDLVAAIIEGRAMTLFDALLSSDAFTQLSSDYLSFIASDSVRKELTGFLSKTGRKVLARSILSNARTKDALQGKKVFVVDESMMVRRYMERKLHEMNLSPQGFSSYEQVLKALSSSKPALLLCGLLVAGASCFPFIDQVRTVYGGETTPVMLVSTGIDPGAALFRDPSKKGDVEGVFRLPAPDPLFRNKIQTLLSQK